MKLRCSGCGVELLVEAFVGLPLSEWPSEETAHLVEWRAQWRHGRCPNCWESPETD